MLLSAFGNLVAHLFADSKTQYICLYTSISLSACKPNWIVHLFTQVSMLLTHFSLCSKCRGRTLLHVAFIFLFDDLV